MNITGQTSTTIDFPFSLQHVPLSTLKLFISRPVSKKSLFTHSNYLIDYGVFSGIQVRFLLLLLIAQPLPRDGGMAEHYRAPEAGQLPRAWPEVVKRQRVADCLSVGVGFDLS